MAVRNAFRRALRRSDSSGSSTHNETSQTSQTSTAASSESSEHGPLHKSSSRLTTWSWGSSKDKDTKERKSSKTKSKRVVHPSQRPLTTQNLEHQKMLSHFTMTFGATNMEQIEPDDFIGISPCCTRAPSLCGDYSSDGSSTPRSFSD